MKNFRYHFVFPLVLIFFLISCSSDDDAQIDSEQFLIADVNGAPFASDEGMEPLGFSRIIMPSGQINLHVRAMSSGGDIIEFMVDNFVGAGKYHVGDTYYNNSWIKYERPTRSESWNIFSGRALNLTSNYIDIIAFNDNYIEGKILCDQLTNNMNHSIGSISGEFKLNFLK